jgi:hypothetical protein
MRLSSLLFIPIFFLVLIFLFIIGFRGLVAFLGGAAVAALLTALVSPDVTSLE